MEERQSQVRKLREDRGWSQRQLSVEADLTIGTISAIENGKRPSLETALRLAGIFGVPVEGLFMADGFTDEVQETPPAGAIAGAAARSDVIPTTSSPDGQTPGSGLPTASAVEKAPAESEIAR